MSQYTIGTPEYGYERRQVERACWRALAALRAAGRDLPPTTIDHRLSDGAEAVVATVRECVESIADAMRTAGMSVVPYEVGDDGEA